MRYNAAGLEELEIDFERDLVVLDDLGVLSALKCLRSLNIW